MADWYYSKGQTRMGPLNWDALVRLAGDGVVSPTDLVWSEGMPDWVQASQVPGLAGPPPLPPQAYAPRPGTSPQKNLGDDPAMRMLIPVGRSGWAIAAGYLGLFSFLILPAPIALITGILAIRDIRSHPDRHGMGRAIFGIVMGVLGTGFLIVSVIAAIRN